MLCRRFLESLSAPPAGLTLPLASSRFSYRVSPVLNSNAVGGDTGGVDDRLHVTPFFASLFPNHFAVIGSCAENNNSALSLKCPLTARRVAAAPRVTERVGDRKSSVKAQPLHPWHAIANIKHAVLYGSNGEDGDNNPEPDASGTSQAKCCSFTMLEGSRDAGTSTDAQLHTRGTTDSDCADKEDEELLLTAMRARLARYSVRNDPTTSSNAASICSNNCTDEDTEKAARDSVPHKKPLTLERVMHASAYAFHHTFEALVRDKQDWLAVKLLRRWWHHNPHLFPLELQLQQRKEVADVLRRVRLGGEIIDDRDRQTIAECLSQVPAKKYLVSSALFGRVLMVALRMGDAVMEEEFVLRELLYDAVYGIVCGGCLAGAEDTSEVADTKSCDIGNKHGVGPSDDALVVGVESRSSEGGPKFHLYKEKYEDWLVFVGAIAAAAMLERHAEKLQREHNRGLTYERLVRAVREEYANFMNRACHPQQGQQSWSSVPFSADVKESLPVLPGWAKMLFTTVFRCYEESGVFHISPARRPGNCALLWRNIHAKLLEKFPHVFHAGSTVATLLSLEALEEAAVSAMGTRRLSFVGKEEALCRWRLECLSCKIPFELYGGVLNGGENTDVDNQQNVGDPYNWPFSDLPRTYKQRRARFVASYSTFSHNGDRENLAASSSLADSGRHQLHWKHREFFGSGVCLSSSRPNIPVFTSPEEVYRCERDALDEVADAWRCTVEIFRDYSSLPLLQLDPASSAFSANDSLRGCDGDTALEVSKPSMFVFLRLMSLLASTGNPPNITAEKGSAGDLHFPLVECIERDIIPLCHPSVAAHLRRCCVTHLSRSGTRGVRLLLAQHQLLLSQKLNEDAALERLLTGLLWSGGNGSHEGVCPRGCFSFGSGSLAWQFIAQQRRTFSSSSGWFMLDLILSHLVTLSLSIPDDHRCAVFVSSNMIAVASDNAREDTAVHSSLRGELSCNPPPAQHLYVSLLQLLAWVVEQEEVGKIDKCRGTGTTSATDATAGVDVELSCECTDGELPSLHETAHHWRTVRRFLCKVSGSPFSRVPFAPSVLERIALILVHTCPDLELLLGSLLTLLLQHQRQQLNKKLFAFCTKSTDGPMNAGQDDTTSPITPRLLSSLCGLLVINGVKGRGVLEWRTRRGAPSCGSEEEKVSLCEWHCSCFESVMQDSHSSCEGQDTRGSGRGAASVAGGEDAMEVTKIGQTGVEAKYLVGSVVLGIVVGDSKWKSFSADNYNVALFLDSIQNDDRGVCARGSSATDGKGVFPLGVVLPSVQMTSLYPAGVRQRVTSIKDVFREMQPDQRSRVRQSLSQRERTEVGGMLADFILPGADAEECDGDIVRQFTQHGAVNGVCHRE
ncbi:uncharacterized protein TEOVI_000192000 [Trypanosoma equiperdum]|uniref:Uncharacterized protein n=1 Tax=Trypanosoma equiperdum TaxID=5694 RepID=A0A1G4IDF3_TRYEQ|nr:hypothetical protein, conserved [Trypanosoma equiperdum]